MRVAFQGEKGAYSEEDKQKTTNEVLGGVDYENRFTKRLEGFRQFSLTCIGLPQCKMKMRPLRLLLNSHF